MPPGRTPIVPPPHHRGAPPRSGSLAQAGRAGRQALPVHPVDARPSPSSTSPTTNSRASRRISQPHAAELPTQSAADRNSVPPPKSPTQSPYQVRKSRAPRKAKARSYSSLGRSPRLSAKTNPRLRPRIPRQIPQIRAARLFPAEKTKLRSATEMYDELRTGALAGLRLGPAARPPQRLRERSHHGALPSRRDRRPGLDHRHRGRVDVANAS